MFAVVKPAAVQSDEALFFLTPVKFGTLQGAGGGAGQAAPVVTVTAETGDMQLTPGVEPVGLVT